MLLIERIPETGIHIGDDIRIKVMRVHGKRVRLGIEAPVSIPVWRDELSSPERDRTQIPRPDSEPADRTPRPPLRVLIVEDDPIHARMIQKALCDTTLAEVKVVTSGEGAVRIIGRNNDGRTFKPDLVLLDLKLPGISGYEFLVTMKSVPALRPTPVVILSSSRDGSDVSTCMAAGANAFVSKCQDYAEFRKSVIRVAEFWSSARHVA